MNDSRDHMPSKEKWEFDSSVTEVFDDMLARSIPQYDVMRDSVSRVAARFVEVGDTVCDLGCSRGESIARLQPLCPRKTLFHGYEISKPMLEAAQERFEDNEWAYAEPFDLRSGYPDITAKVTLAVLTLMFIPIEHRQRLVGEIYNHTKPGGAFILVEKLIGSYPSTDKIIGEEYLDMKKRNGYSPEAIERKKLSLEGALVPVTAWWNKDMLQNAGFAEVECFWRWMNFAAWVAIKR